MKENKGQYDTLDAPNLIGVFSGNQASSKSSYVLRFAGLQLLQKAWLVMLRHVCEDDTLLMLRMSLGAFAVYFSTLTGFEGVPHRQ